MVAVGCSLGPIRLQKDNLVSVILGYWQLLDTRTSTSIYSCVLTPPLQMSLKIKEEIKSAEIFTLTLNESNSLHCRFDLSISGKVTSQTPLSSCPLLMTIIAFTTALHPKIKGQTRSLEDSLVPFLSSS